ncbi:unnamed protein product (macronuclear) [Paramecium tetraurelia]|uniref:Uncharacterized protein n=1 Tax=Paramecium tetraurelia TaxID=5888 RepID=A0EEY4_PARTE|nr:uncharacterized protein GSPATT00026198001 [Paramecium tetraurelia]CAK93875.1 unnamed protein product [Paramecium tetraurelia]|eukprot:XP_001461248.1 hypothetical protein (macronuclear) [Paramecium tetraurelia strain d4-2]
MLLLLQEILKLLKHHSKKLKDIKKRIIILYKQIMEKNSYLVKVVNETKYYEIAVTLKEFKPKLAYDPNNRRNKELYGNEIARDNLLTKEVNLEASNPQKIKLTQKQQDYNPSNRKLTKNQSSVFGDSPKQFEVKLIQQLKAKKLKTKSIYLKWSTFEGQSINQVKEFDPETFEKNRKEAELQSSVFGEKSIKAQNVSISESKEESETNNVSRNCNFSSIRTTTILKIRKPKERLIPNNSTWQQLALQKQERL